MGFQLVHRPVFPSSRNPETAQPTSPTFAVRSFVFSQPRSPLAPHHSSVLGEPTAENEARSEENSETVSLEQPRHGLVPTLPPLAPRATGESPPAPRNSDLGGRILRQELARRPMPTARTGLPDRLKTGIENLSGFSMGDIEVHYNSAKPARFLALAYAQGTDIHLGPGQERYLPHEAWHVVQQKQGRVRPTLSMPQGVPVNDSPALEREADAMGAKALRGFALRPPGLVPGSQAQPHDSAIEAGNLDFRTPAAGVIQRIGVNDYKLGIEYETTIVAERLEGGAVPQDEQMFRSPLNGWEVQSDNSRLEFVTDPLSVDRLDRAVKGFTGLLLDRHFSTKLKKGGKLSELLPVPFRNRLNKNYNILKHTPPITGNPQLTVGIPLAELSVFFDLLTTYELRSSKDLVESHKKAIPTLKNPEKVAQAEASLKHEESTKKLAIREDTAKIFSELLRRIEGALQAKPEIGKLPPEERAKLKSLLHFIAQYALFSTGKKIDSYKKAAFPLMSRSSFSSMHADLTEPTREVFAKMIAQFLDKGIERPTFPGEGSTFTIGMWIDSIKDPKKWINELGMYADEMTNPETKSNMRATDRSMGNMGLDNGRVVVELRSIHHFASKDLGDFTPLTVQKLVVDARNLLTEIGNREDTERERYQNLSPLY